MLTRESMKVKLEMEMQGKEKEEEMAKGEVLEEED